MSRSSPSTSGSSMGLTVTAVRAPARISTDARPFEDGDRRPRASDEGWQLLHDRGDARARLAVDEAFGVDPKCLTGDGERRAGRRIAGRARVGCFTAVLDPFG